MRAHTLSGLHLLSLASPLQAALSNSSSCRNLPGDAGWPTRNDWLAFNNSVSGRLIATIPQASVCHSSPYTDYNETACQILANNWGLAQTFEPHSAEILNAFYQNQSCDPFTPVDRSCQLGNYAVYSVNISTPDDVISTVKFAAARNLRLVVKSTGHDYLGKSSGRGALSMWTGNLKSANITQNYTSQQYTGPAIRLGSGMIAGEAYKIAHDAGYRLVGGECASVGIAAGYTQGGGHSLLISEYGMAADQVLEWEVVTPMGEHLFATPQQNIDLYWALSGGGGGTWGVVLSMTARLHREGPVSGGALSFTNSDNSAYWKAVGLLFERAPTLVSVNNSVFFSLAQTGFDAISILLPGQPVQAVEELMEPVLSGLRNMSLTYSFNVTSSCDYYEHFSQSFGPLPYGTEPISASLSNRLIPRTVVESPDALGRLIQAFQGIVQDGNFFFGCFFMNANSSHPNNAVLPAWRQASVGCNVNALWNYTAPLQHNLALKRRLVDEIVPVMEAVTPDGGMYLNEMDPWYRGDWKRNLYGKNYQRLLSIKHRYDPSHLLWGNFSVASDELSIDDTGRLCPSR